ARLGVQRDAFACSWGVTRGSAEGGGGRSPPGTGKLALRAAGLGVELRARRDRLGRELAVPDLIGPRVEHRDLVMAGVAHPEVDEVVALPEALEVQLVVEGEDLQELVAIVAVAIDVVARRAVAQRHAGDLLQRLLERVAAKARRVPGDVDDARHQAPTSARIAPGPSAVLPWPSSVAPTRMAILPQCLFSCMSWGARATSSNGIVCHSTGRILAVALRW